MRFSFLKHSCISRGLSFPQSPICGRDRAVVLEEPRETVTRSISRDTSLTPRHQSNTHTLSQIQTRTSKKSIPVVGRPQIALVAAGVLLRGSLLFSGCLLHHSHRRSFSTGRARDKRPRALRRCRVARATCARFPSSSGIETERLWPQVFYPRESLSRSLVHKDRGGGNRIWGVSTKIELRLENFF